MQKTLLLNHLSAQPDGYICDCAQKGQTALLEFFRTIKTAIEQHGFERYIISDKEFWTIAPSADCSLTDFINNLSRTNQRWVYELHRLACKSSTDFFSDELIERIMSYSPIIRGIGKQSEHFGCAACVEGVVAVSFSVNEFWHQTTILLDWYDGEERIDSQEQDFGEKVYNISKPDDISIILGYFPQEEPAITQEYWGENLPTTIPLDTFWSWFNSLDESVRKSLFKVACTVQKKNWLARKWSSFQKLRDNELCEIRCWPDGGATVRVYVKVESPEKIVLLNGSGKKDQDDEIERAIRLYTAYKSESKTQ